MRISLSVFFAVILLSPTFTVAQNNLIGIADRTEPPLYPCIQVPGPGLYDVFLFLVLPVGSDATPLDRIEGYELSVSLPSSWILHETTLPAGVTNSAVLPEFVCSGTIPITGDVTILATLTLLTFDPVPEIAYLAPATPSSIPGSMVIHEGGTPGGPLAANSIAGDYSSPLFGLNFPYNCTVPDESTQSWSTIKALYR